MLIVFGKPGLINTDSKVIADVKLQIIFSK